MAKGPIKLPYQQSNDRVFNLFQTQLASALNPLTSQPMAKSKIITNVRLVSGANTIQTGLGYPITGWYIIRQRANASIWDNQDSNTASPNTTLILESSAGTTINPIIIDLVVF